jgi:hypothetical protein
MIRTSWLGEKISLYFRVPATARVHSKIAVSVLRLTGRLTQQYIILRFPTNSTKCRACDRSGGSGGSGGSGFHRMTNLTVPQSISLQLHDSGCCTHNRYPGRSWTPKIYVFSPRSASTTVLYVDDSTTSDQYQGLEHSFDSDMKNAILFSTLIDTLHAFAVEPTSTMQSRCTHKRPLRR